MKIVQPSPPLIWGLSAQSAKPWDPAALGRVSPTGERAADQVWPKYKSDRGAPLLAT